MARYVNYNGNPAKIRVGDCVVRAISKALGQEWGETFLNLCMYGYINCDMPSANHVWGQYLKSKGFKRDCVDDGDREFYTVANFCDDHPKGTYVLALSSHVVAVIDGRYYDTWDSGNEIPIYYWCKDEKKEGEQ